MIDEKLLKWIQCPISGQLLNIAGPELVAKLNEKIAAGELRDRSDQLVETPFDEGLLTADGARLYPVRADIPTLITDNCIELNAQIS